MTFTARDGHRLVEGSGDSAEELREHGDQIQRQLVQVELRGEGLAEDLSLLGGLKRKTEMSDYLYTKLKNLSLP